MNQVQTYQTNKLNFTVSIYPIDTQLIILINSYFFHLIIFTSIPNIHDYDSTMQKSPRKREKNSNVK